MSEENHEFIKLLIQSNFVEMLKSKDIRAIKEFKNNPNAVINLIIAMGAGNKILESPAHLQMLEEMIGKILDSLEDALEDTKAGCGYSVGFDNQDRLTVKIESFSTQDDYKLSILENAYTFESAYVYSGIGHGKRIVNGNVDKKQILDFEDKSTFDETKNSGKKLVLDDFGFVIDEIDGVKTTTYKSIPGTYEREKVVSKSGAHISRDGANVTTRKSSILPWGGDALHLNDEEVEKLEVYKRAMITILKCPNAQKYYEDTLGIEISPEKILHELDLLEN